MLLVAVLFQNCSRLGFTSEESDSPQMSGNGWAYDGKVYDSTVRCPDTGLPATKIKANSADSFLLLKDNCQVLKEPIALNAADVELNPSQPETLTYRGQAFTAEPVPVNKIAFVQKSEAIITTQSTSAMSTPFSGATTNGDLVVCAVLYNSPNAVAQITSMTDNLGNVYQRAVAPKSVARDEGYSGYTAEVWYAENVRGGNGHRATANFSEQIPANQFVNCYEYSGIMPQNSLENSFSTAIHTSTASSLTLGPVSTNWSNSLVFVAYFGQIESVPTGFTERGFGGDSAADRILTSTADFTLNLPVGGSAVAAVVTFRSE